MTDINEIRARRAACADIPWSCACASGEQLDALVAEVERMRGEMATLILQADEVVRDHAEHFREQERAAVVAWLRGGAGLRGGEPAEEWDDLWVAARDIERGEHRREEER